MKNIGTQLDDQVVWGRDSQVLPKNDRDFLFFLLFISVFCWG